MTFTGNVSSAGGAGNSQSGQNQNPGNETPEEWSTGEARGTQEAGQYPNYLSTHTKSGHSFVMDDSKGAESVTLQHRSGSSVQFKPDGQLLITAHNGKYEITFGENRMTISGAQDITVKGDASLRVYGDYNVTCHKNYNLAVMGDLNITAKNKNQHIRGNKDTQMKNETKKVEGSSSVTAGGGIARVSKGSVTVASQAGKAHFVGATGLHASVTKKGDMTFDHQGQGNMHMNVAEGFFDGLFSDGSDKVSIKAEGGSFHTQADNDVNTKAKNGKMKMTAKQDVGVESETGGVQATGMQNVQVKSTSGDVQVQALSGDLDARAGGSASLEGVTATHVAATGGQTHITSSGGGINIDPTGGLLNLAGGLGIPFGGLGQLSFNFGTLTQALGMPQISGVQSQMTQEEPDAESWTKGLL